MAYGVGLTIRRQQFWSVFRVGHSFIQIRLCYKQDV